MKDLAPELAEELRQCLRFIRELIEYPGFHDADQRRHADQLVYLSPKEILSKYYASIGYVMCEHFYPLDPKSTQDMCAECDLDNYLESLKNGSD
jgi:hypothetical protein